MSYKDLEELERDLQKLQVKINAEKPKKSKKFFNKSITNLVIAELKASELPFDKWLQEQVRLIKEPICLILDGQKTQIKMWVKG